MSNTYPEALAVIRAARLVRLVAHPGATPDGPVYRACGCGVHVTLTRALAAYLAKAQEYVP